MTIHLKEFGWDRYIDETAITSVGSIYEDEAYVQKRFSNDYEWKKYHVLKVSVGGTEQVFSTEPKFFGGVAKNLIELREHLIRYMP